MDVVGDSDVELTVPVVVDEGATGAPFLACAGDACLFGNLVEAAAALVVIQAVFTVAGYVQVGQAIGNRIEVGCITGLASSILSAAGG